MFSLDTSQPRNLDTPQPTSVDRSIDLRAVSRYVRRHFNVWQCGGELALRAAIVAGLVHRHREVVAIRLFAAIERARALERAHGAGEVARAIQPFGDEQHRRMIDAA